MYSLRCESPLRSGPGESLFLTNQKPRSLPILTHFLKKRQHLTKQLSSVPWNLLRIPDLDSILKPSATRRPRSLCAGIGVVPKLRRFLV